ncbi:MAG: MFS transporter [Candidatus Limnocylindrales bacterium]
MSVEVEPAVGVGAGVTPEVRLVSRAFVALALAALAFFVAGGIVLPVAPRFASGPLGADAFGFGVSIGAFAIAALLARPIVGWASDRYGRRPLLLLGAGITIAGLGLHLLATDLIVFTLARGLLGIGEGFFFVAALAAGSDIAPVTRRGEALSFLSLSLYMGVVIGPVVGEVVLANGGFDAVWLVAAGMTGVALLLSLAVPETAPARVAAIAAAAGGEVEQRRARGRLFHPRGLLPGLLVLAGAWGMSGYFTFLPFYATGVGLDGAGAPLAIYGLTVIVLRAFGARLPDQLGAARLSGVAMVVVVGGLSVIGLVPTPAGLLIGTVLYASGVAFLFPALMTCAVGRVDPEERGSVLGTTSAFLDLGFGIGPVALSLLAAGGTVGTASMAGLSATFLVSAAVAAVGATILYLRRRDLAPSVVATG